MDSISDRHSDSNAPLPYRLLVMTYNVGLFFAVLAGHLIGSLAFGRFMKSNPDPISVTEDCCSTNP